MAMVTRRNGECLAQRQQRNFAHDTVSPTRFHIKWSASVYLQRLQDHIVGDMSVDTLHPNRNVGVWVPRLQDNFTDDIVSPQRLQEHPI